MYRVLITWYVKGVQQSYYQYGIHWIERLRLHLNLYFWRPLGDVFRALIIVQWWSLNKAGSTKIQGRAEHIIHEPKHLQLFDLRECFDESLNFRSLSMPASQELMHDSLEAGAFTDVMFRFPCSLSSGDVVQVLRHLLLWSSVLRLRLHRRSSS